MLGERTAVVSREGVNAHRDLIGDGVPSGASLLTLPALFLAAQGEMQRATFALVSLDALVDALVAHAGLLLTRR